MTRSTSRRLRLSGASLLLLGAMSFRAPAPHDDDALVVLVLHGRGMLGRDTAMIREEWRRAVETGVRRLGDSVPSPAVDLRLVWYADALDPSTPAACSAGATGRDAGSLGILIQSLGEMIPTAAREGAGSLFEGRALLGDILYFLDETRRCAATERLESALRAVEPGRRVVVVGHSFGSIVAYDHLRARGATEPAVARFVTVGSPLGSRAVRELLFADPAVSQLAGVGEWINVVDPRDPIATRFGGDGIVGPRDVRVDGGSSHIPHDVAAYLSDPVTARAIRGR